MTWPNAKLTELQKIQAADRYQRGEAYKSIAQDFGCSISTVRKHIQKHLNLDPKDPRVECEKKDLTLAEELRWALQAVGQFKAKKRHPRVTPSWGAWFLYLLAQEKPDQFLGRVVQAARTHDTSSETKDEMRKDSKRSIKELNQMLDTLEKKSDETKPF